jgi:hypothetical protein
MEEAAEEARRQAQETAAGLAKKLQADREDEVYKANAALYNETVYRPDGNGGMIGYVPPNYPSTGIVAPQGVGFPPIKPDQPDLFADLAKKLDEQFKVTKGASGTTGNPKEAAGAKKPAIWSVMPRWVILEVGRVMQFGASKYGAFNYRWRSGRAGTYQDAMERHAQLWFDGEDIDPESGVSHLAHVIANALILMDCQANGTLIDDRQKTGIVRKKLNELEGLLKSLPFPSAPGSAAAPSKA